LNERRGRVVLAGGSGFLGSALSDSLFATGYDVVVLSRASHPNTERVTYAVWDGKGLGAWASYVDGAAAVVNLAGKNVSCRYTPENRAEIIASRVDSVRVLGEAIASAARPPPVFVQAGSLAIYGDTGDRVCDENAAWGTGFPVETCVEWERAFAALATLPTRTVLLRIGFALGKDGGALELLAGLTRAFLGGTVADGAQYISFLHVRDLCRMFHLAIENPDVRGIYNATGPNPATNRDFMRALRHALGRPWSPPTPAWAVVMGCFFLGTEPSLALTGRRCVPRRFTEETGFEFELPELAPALAAVFEKPQE
jgi:uncharacterized protein (TIGR01777 family)